MNTETKHEYHLRRAREWDEEAATIDASKFPLLKEACIEAAKLHRESAERERNR